MRAFADTNVIVYAQSDDGRKTATAIKLLETGPVISAQVVNETVAIFDAQIIGSLWRTLTKWPFLFSSPVKSCQSRPRQSAKLFA